MQGHLCRAKVIQEVLVLEYFKPFMDCAKLTGLKFQQGKGLSSRASDFSGEKQNRTFNCLLIEIVSVPLIF
jgi:hypothetical protein